MYSWKCYTLLKSNNVLFTLSTMDTAISTFHPTYFAALLRPILGRILRLILVRTLRLILGRTLRLIPGRKPR